MTDVMHRVVDTDAHRLHLLLSTVFPTPVHKQVTGRSPSCSPYSPQGFSGTVGHMHEHTIPTWAAPDVIVDDLHALAEHHRRLGITARDARALRRVAAIITAHDEHAEAEVA